MTRTDDRLLLFPLPKVSDFSGAAITDLKRYVPAGKYWSSGLPVPLERPQDVP